MKNHLFLLFLLSLYFSVNGQILKKKIPNKLVVLSFDDATASQYTVVAPLLQQYGFGATFFVCEYPTKMPDRSAYMNWQQIRELDTMGFEIANHTRTHRPVNKMTKSQFVEELHYIEAQCDSMGITKPSNFAYPGYNLNAETLEILQQQGYQFARAGGSRAYEPLQDSPLLVPSWATNATNKEQIMAALKQAKKGRIVVLTLHGVPDVEHPWVNTPPELFKEYLQYLSDHHYKVIAFRDLEKYIDVEQARQTITADLNKGYKNL
jgi:peptidoglycan-N-acetylglucosamine deacetylase